MIIEGDNDLASRDGLGKLKPLADGQFDIDGFTFGGVFDQVLLDSFDPGEAEWLTQDATNPRGGNLVFGRDVLSGPTWGFEGFTNGYDIDDAQLASERLASVWRGSERKKKSGTYQILRYRIGNRTRRVYGRGRKFWSGIDPRSYSGTAPVSMTFQLLSNDHFDDEQREELIPILPLSMGGLKAPLTAPLLSHGLVQSRAGMIESVGGTKPTPFHLYIRGPVSIPKVYGPGWSFGLNTSVGPGRTVHISTHGSMIAVEDDLGRNLSGYLGGGTKISEARLRPGSAPIYYEGNDPTNTSWAKVVWRPAYEIL